MGYSYPPLRRRATLLDAYQRFIESNVQPFTVPGHKRRMADIDEGLALATDNDVPLYGGLDTIKLSNGHLAQAESRAAALFGADWCRFSTGGSTHANQAMCLALGTPGDEVIVTRTLHRSTLLGLVLAGLVPRWLPSRIDKRTGIPLGTLADDVAEALDDTPRAVAVLLTEPGYLGTIGQLESSIHAAHVHDVPVIVDQAWGAHLGFHPDLPRHAMALGADAMVTSIHKLLPGCSQASLVCASTRRLDLERLERGFDATHTTSPAGSILASIDGSLALMQDRGADLLGTTIDLIARARERFVTSIPGIVVPDQAYFGVARYDPLRLTISLPGTGANGIEVERRLIDLGLTVEMADRDTIIPVVTIADDRSSIEQMTASIITAVAGCADEPRSVSGAISWRVLGQSVLTPRDAFFAPHERVSAREALGRVSAELIAPYPPGIPVFAPGELITEDVLDSLMNLAAEGVRIAYASDPTLATFDVVRET
ncbi:MAG: aminotransferase class V-fold PLP-dependent enzyme [Acidimicrobiales bacterium]